MSGAAREIIDPSEFLTMERLAELFTVLFENLSPKAQAQLRWAPKTFEDKIAYLLDNPIDDGLLVNAYNGAIQVLNGTERDELWESTSSLLRGVIKSTIETGQFDGLVTQMKISTGAENTTHPASVSDSKRSALRKIDVIAEHDYCWSSGVVYALGQSVFQLFLRHASEFMTVPFGEEEADEEQELEEVSPIGDGELLEPVSTFEDLQPLPRAGVIFFIALSGFCALDLAAENRANFRTFIRVTQEISQLFERFSQIIEQAEYQAATEHRQLLSETDPDEETLENIQRRQSIFEMFLTVLLNELVILI